MLMCKYGRFDMIHKVLESGHELNINHTNEKQESALLLLCKSNKRSKHLLITLRRMIIEHHTNIDRAPITALDTMFNKMLEPPHDDFVRLLTTGYRLDGVPLCIHLARNLMLSETGFEMYRALYAYVDYFTNFKNETSQELSDMRRQLYYHVLDLQFVQNDILKENDLDKIHIREFHLSNIDRLLRKERHILYGDVTTIDLNAKDPMNGKTLLMVLIELYMTTDLYVEKYDQQMLSDAISNIVYLWKDLDPYVQDYTTKSVYDYIVELRDYCTTSSPRYENTSCISILTDFLDKEYMCVDLAFRTPFLPCHEGRCDPKVLTLRVPTDHFRLCVPGYGNVCLPLHIVNSDAFYLNNVPVLLLTPDILGNNEALYNILKQRAHHTSDMNDKPIHLALPPLLQLSTNHTFGLQPIYKPLVSYVTLFQLVRYI